MTTATATVASVLGDLRVRKGADRVDYDRHIREGLPVSSLERLKGLLDLSDRDIASLVGMSARSITRIKKSRERLSPVAGDRLYRSAHIFAFAIEVLGGVEQAKQWLKSPQYGLGERIPLSMMETEAGAKEVEDLLGRIEHGVYS
jgi:putative toxin-antitoxin system antitoxin component (TIGR02293 family)